MGFIDISSIDYIFSNCTKCFAITLILSSCGIDNDNISNELIVETSSQEVEPEELYKHELDKLYNNTKIQAALNFIKNADSLTINDLVTITEVEAPPFDERMRGEVFAEMLSKTQLDSVWMDGIGNVIGIRKGTSGQNTLGVAAHLDTVFPKGTSLKVTQRGDTFFAPGILDNSRGLAILLALNRAMSAALIETEDDILFIGNVGEEGLGDLRGVKYLFGESGLKIDALIAIDGNITDLINRGLGSHRYRVVFNGPGGHSWNAFGLGNPHHAMGSAIKYFVDEADKYTSSGLKTSYNVGKIGGGTSVNSIPFESWMEVDMRSISADRLIEIDSIFHKAMRKGLMEQNSKIKEGKKITIDFEMIGNRPSGEIPSSDPLVQRGLAVMVKMGQKPILKTGSTDSNVPISLGIPAITIGEGELGGGSHSLDEYFIDKNSYLTVQKVFIIMISQAGLSAEN